MIIMKTAGINQAEALNLLTQQIATLTQKFQAFQVNSQSLLQLENCDVCEGNRPNHECQASVQNEEQVNVIGYRNNYPFGSSIAQKHPGFQWSNLMVLKILNNFLIKSSRCKDYLIFNLK